MCRRATIGWGWCRHSCSPAPRMSLPRCGRFRMWPRRGSWSGSTRGSPAGRGRPTRWPRRRGRCSAIPTPAATATASAAYTSGGKVVSASGDEVVYVSLTPGTAPSGSSASFRRVGAAQPTTAPMFDGGADPVALSAQAGDSIDVVVTDVHGNQVYRQRLGVAAYRPPVVVRTDPSRSKTDVAINASIVIVFSEPVAAGSLTSSSVQLFQGTTPVAGTVS